MKYYKLDFSLNVDEVGKYPQIETMYNLGDIEKVDNYPMAYKQSIDFIWDIPQPILYRQSKLTTLLSGGIFSSFILLVFRTSFVRFLERFNLGEYRSWPIKVHYKGQIFKEYSLFHISYPSDEQYVDYASSEFLIGTSEDWQNPDIRKPVKVEGYANYQSLMEVLKENENNARIRCNKLIFDFTGTDIDMFRLIDIPFGEGYYVSERLKTAIEEQGFTGMAFEEIEEYEKGIKVVY
ncbi:MAG: hypothetical protein R2814_18495 [Flavobacteriaceae bacterium]